MNHEQSDFDSWGAAWRSSSPEADVSVGAIRKRVRRFVWFAVANWLIGLALLTGITAFAWSDPRPPVVTAAVAVWLFVAAATAVDLRFYRGSWRAAGDSTEHFIELARRQAVARLRSLRFGWYVIAGELIFFLVWVPWVVSTKPDPTLARYFGAFGYVVALVTVFSIGLAWAIRRAERRLQRLEAVRKELTVLDRAA